MGRFRVVVFDRCVRHLEKEFDAESEAEARERADEEEQTIENGWLERYEELFSEQSIDHVVDVTDEQPVDGS